MTSTKPSPEELEQQIQQQREDLAHTVDALQAKLDVKAHAKRKADDVRNNPALLAGVAAAVVVVTALVVWRRRR
jgi:hypothetical protein